MAESNSSPLITIPPEIEAEMTPAVKAFVLAAFAQFEARIAALEKEAALSDEADKLLVDEVVSPTAGRRFTRA